MPNSVKKIARESQEILNSKSTIDNVVNYCVTLPTK